MTPPEPAPAERTMLPAFVEGVVARPAGMAFVEGAERLRAAFGLRGTEP